VLEVDKWIQGNFPVTDVSNVLYFYKTAKEQVQDEILIKMARAIENNNLEQAKKLIELAKAIKEL
jgi:excinuclease UvrABC nuclease subunit